MMRGNLLITAMLAMGTLVVLAPGAAAECATAQVPAVWEGAKAEACLSAGEGEGGTDPGCTGPTTEPPSAGSEDVDRIFEILANNGQTVALLNFASEKAFGVEGSWSTQCQTGSTAGAGATASVDATGIVRWLFG